MRLLVPRVQPVLQAKRRALGEDHLDTCFAAMNLQAVWVASMQRSRYAEAEAVANATVTTLCKLLGPTHPTTLRGTMHHAAVVLARGDAVKASEMLRDCYAAQVEAHGSSSHPDVLETAWRLGKSMHFTPREQRRRG